MGQGDTKQNRNNNLQSSGASELQSGLQAIQNAYGLTEEQLSKLLEGVSQGKQIVDEIQEPKLHKDKELIWDDPSAYIYKRNNTKNKFWYYRHYDKATKQRYVKSLGTTDRIKAISAARIIYQEVKGKVEQGQKLKNIITKDLITLFLKREQLKISDIPKAGITEQRYRVKSSDIRYWQWYIDDLGLSNRPIDTIQPSKVRDFGYWLQKFPKLTERDKGKPRSAEVINNCISVVKQMYKDIAVRDKYIRSDQIPDIEKLKQRNDGTLKRDILSLEQYEKLWKHLEYKYCKDKDIDDAEKQKRIIFTKMIGVLANTGLRSSELFGLKVNEVYPNPLEKDKNSDIMLIKVRATNSKTGVQRVLTAPIRRRITLIKEAYKKLGIESNPNEFLFRSTQRSRHKPYTREQIAKRLKRVLKESGLQDELDSEGKIINLYSFRHQYISWRLRYGDVPLPLLSRAVGNSVAILMKNYAHIQVEKQSDVLNRAQGAMKMAEIDLGTNLYNSEEE